MATKIIAAPAQRDPAIVFGCALALLEEILQENEKTYCLATVGASYCQGKESAGIESKIFLVIEDRLADNTTLGLLRDYLNEFARLAGVEVQS